MTDTDSKFVLTFRGGQRPDAPRVEVHGNSIQELLDVITGDGAKELAALMEKMGRREG
ncbi:hypothetical protein PT015_23265 [Candidatus Mycobacterium wuenschmannii]|uniref:Uncharacterized protein n=1 Tax=Candidatus Mycobacterium wuenschmannii TaxID=3027808 RepID=A0ABY8W1P9_9MYCO|nr:hypothetical protein [Candidatus Mycobacterium wuenschmannii]WIM87714.1 hypothetical protein PT015_23265 [Candidatus Mycobacterium wuenschmannii]